MFAKTSRYNDAWAPASCGPRDRRDDACTRRKAGSRLPRSDRGWASRCWRGRISVDAAGNVYTTGFFSRTVDFDPGAETANLTSAGAADIFVSKLDNAGNFVWARNMGGTSGDFDVGLGVIVDAAGNVYTTGYFNGTADFDPGAGTANLTSAGGADIFISKLDNAGNFVWALRPSRRSRQFGVVDLRRGADISVRRVFGHDGDRTCAAVQDAGRQQAER